MANLKSVLSISESARVLTPICPNVFLGRKSRPDSTVKQITPLAQLSIPESVCVLATIFPDVALYFSDVFCDQNSECASASKHIAPLLDALTFFFPTIPGDGKTYAMTLAVDEKEVVATVAVNDTTHLDSSSLRPYAFPESWHSPRDILENVWAHMIQLAPDTNTIDGNGNVNDTIRDRMLVYLYRTHTLKILHRFEKWSKEFDQIWSAISADNASDNTVSSKKEDTIPSSSEQPAITPCKGSTVNFFSDETYDPVYKYGETSKEFKSYLDAAKAIYDAHRSFYETNKVETLILNLIERNLPHLSCSLEKKFGLYDSMYLDKIHKAAVNPDKNRNFNLIRYISKLSSPLLHVMAIGKIAASRTFETISKLPLRITMVPNSPSTIHAEPSTVLPSLAKTFLLNAYKSTQEDDADYLEDVINGRTIRETEIRISSPHCECLLIRHHHLADFSAPRPFSYIGISKLSCLQCGIFLNAYNKYAKEVGHTTFSVKESQTDILPYSVPSISSAVDVSIAKHMSDSIRTVVTTMLSPDVVRLRQNILGSNSDDETDLVV